MLLWVRFGFSMLQPCVLTFEIVGENQSLGKATWKNKWCWYPFPVPAPQALGVGHRWCDAQVSIQPWVRAPGRRIWVLSCQRWNSTDYVGWELPTLQVLQRATCFSCRPKRSEKCFWCNSTVDITRWFSDGFLYHSPCWGEESVSSSKWVFMRIRFDDGISSHDKTSLPKLQKMKTKPSSPISMPSKYPLIRCFVSVWGLDSSGFVQMLRALSHYSFPRQWGNTMRSKHRRLPQLLRFKHMWQSGIEPRYPFGVASHFSSILETGLELTS